MLSKRIKKELRYLTKGKLFFNEPLKNHSSFRIGGPAAAFAIPASIDDLRNIITFTRNNKIPLFILGKGTNILINDKGIKGVVIQLSRCCNYVKVSGERVSAGAGYSLAKLSRLAADHNLSGLEFAVGIPGTLGGAVIMNAGTRDQSISSIITKINVMDLTGKIYPLKKEELAYGYRKSRLQKLKVIVLAAELKLRKGAKNDILRKMEEYTKKRKQTQPLKSASAGSIFKNPVNHSAGRLIQTAGAKSLRLGGAQISDKHANFILNLGNASFQDVTTLIKRVQQLVYKKCRIKLEPEIAIIKT